MPFIKNVRMKPIIDGFVIKYDYFDKGADIHDSLRFVSTVEESETNGAKAIKRLEELRDSDENLDFSVAIPKGSSHKK